jgi:hypothetical protein
VDDSIRRNVKEKWKDGHGYVAKNVKTRAEKVSK